MLVSKKLNTKSRGASVEAGYPRLCGSETRCLHRTSFNLLQVSNFVFHVHAVFFDDPKVEMAVFYLKA